MDFFIISIGRQQPIVLPLPIEVGRLADPGFAEISATGHLPERSIMTGIGAVEVCVPRVRDRLSGTDDRIRFSSAILPPYARRSKSLEVLIPILYLKGHFHRRLRRGALRLARPERYCSRRSSIPECERLNPNALIGKDVRHLALQLAHPRTMG